MLIQDSFLLSVSLAGRESALLPVVLLVQGNWLSNSLNFVLGCAGPQHWEAVEGTASYAFQEKDTCAWPSLCEPHRP